MERFWNQYPLLSLLVIAAAVRLLAAWFSAGYAMHDDHFLVVEVAQSWADGQDVYQWITSTKETNTSGRSLFYPGLVAGLFWTLDELGCHNPQIKMLILRLLQALYSVLAVYYVYKIVWHWTDEHKAREAGLLVALLWLMPYISVRTLAEVVSIPPLLAATWALLNPRYARKWIWPLCAGLLIGIAFSLRYQTLLYGAGLGLALLWQRKWAELLWLVFGTTLWIAFMHGWVEWRVWGYPFGKIEYYVQYNLVNKDAYFKHPWYNYLLMLPALLFPVGLLYAWGTVREGYRFLPLFLGFLLFLVFHSTLPNKQERFMFTMIPMFIALGAMGWGIWRARSAFWQRRPALLSGLWAFFWVVNTIALVVFSTYFPKQGRVEAMLGIWNAEYGIRNTEYGIRNTEYGMRNSVLVVDGKAGTPAPMPLFYCGGWPEVVNYGKDDAPEVLRERLGEMSVQPKYALVLENAASDAVVAELQQVFPDMQLLHTYQSNAFDRFLHWLNPLNRTESVRLYRMRN